MPEDADFKKLVRRRMATTGERYTDARAALRAAADGPKSDAIPLRSTLLRTTIADVEAWRPEPPGWPPPPPAGPPHWLYVEAVGPVRPDVAVPLGTLPVLADALGAAPLVVHGFDIEVDVPADVLARPTVGDKRPEQEWIGAHRASLERRLEEVLDAPVMGGLSIPAPCPSASWSPTPPGRPPWSRWLCRWWFRVAINGHRRRSPAESQRAAGAVGGAAWSGYGLVLRTTREFEILDLSGHQVVSEDGAPQPSFPSWGFIEVPDVAAELVAIVAEAAAEGTPELLPGGPRFPHVFAYGPGFPGEVRDPIRSPEVSP